MRVRVSPLALAGLLGLASINAGLLAVALEDTTPEATVKGPVAATEQAPIPPSSGPKLLKPKPITAYGETLAKPVLFKSRAPYVPPPPAPPAPPPKPVSTAPPASVDPGLVLGGVVIMEEAKKAYIFNKADLRGAWLSEGESILGWRLDAIDAAAARLARGDRSIELQLYPKR